MNGSNNHSDTIYEIDHLAEMFHLRHGEVESFIRDQGTLYYHVPTLSLVGYIPALNSSFKLNERTEKICRRNISLKHQAMKLEDSIISIASKQPTLPPSSFLLLPNWLRHANKILDVTPDFHLLVSADKHRPVYCGHKKFVNRLATEFPIETMIFPIPSGGDVFNAFK